MLGFNNTVTDVLYQLDKIVDQLEEVKGRNETSININQGVINNLTVANQELIEDNARAKRVQKNIYGLTE